MYLVVPCEPVARGHTLHRNHHPFPAPALSLWAKHDLQFGWLRGVGVRREPVHYAGPCGTCAVYLPHVCCPCHSQVSIGVQLCLCLLTRGCAYHFVEAVCRSPHHDRPTPRERSSRPFLFTRHSRPGRDRRGEFVRFFRLSDPARFCPLSLPPTDRGVATINCCSRRIYDLHLSRPTLCRRLITMARHARLLCGVAVLHRSFRISLVGRVIDGFPTVVRHCRRRWRRYCRCHRRYRWLGRRLRFGFLRSRHAPNFEFLSPVFYPLQPYEFLFLVY